MLQVKPIRWSVTIASVLEYDSLYANCWWLYWHHYI